MLKVTAITGKLFFLLTSAGSLPFMTQDDIELRVCSNEAPSIEGTPLDIIELYFVNEQNANILIYFL